MGAEQTSDRHGVGETGPEGFLGSLSGSWPSSSQLPPLHIPYFQTTSSEPKTVVALRFCFVWPVTGFNIF